MTSYLQIDVVGIFILVLITDDRDDHIEQHSTRYHSALIGNRLSHRDSDFIQRIWLVPHTTPGGQTILSKYPFQKQSPNLRFK